MERKNAWKNYSKEEIMAAEQWSSLYRRFLDRGKTERECISEAVRIAERNGYKNLKQYISDGTALKPGDKVYLSHMEKSAAFFYIGEMPLEDGMHIIGSHVDSPRLDIKQIPCYEEAKQVYLDTHYYGGVKKYQWLSLPLALHGVVVKKDGSKTEICIGEEADDPVFVITDLLPHLGKERNEQKVREFVDGEKMDLLIGNRPIMGEGLSDGEGLSGEGEIPGDGMLRGEEILPEGKRLQKGSCLPEGESLLKGRKPAGEKPGSEGTGFSAENGRKKEEEAEVKERILQILRKKYQIEEEDFLSAELEVVPAGRARECGIDRSMILAYGQDDRSCAFASLMALLYMAGEAEKEESDDPAFPGILGPAAVNCGKNYEKEKQCVQKTNAEGKEKQGRRTACCLLVDKEETGSNGATGMKSRFFENTAAELLTLCQNSTKERLPFEIRLRRCLMHSRMLSADVSAAFDPMYEKYFEKKNAAYLANGLVFNKYSGSGGKNGANDANPEFMAELRRIMEKGGVCYQTAELGAVDQGGGGTIAYIMARYGMDVIDCGLAVLGMHAPWEVTSKADLYETIKGYAAFYLS